MAESTRPPGRRSDAPRAPQRRSDARGVATITLARVFVDQAFASRALDAELAQAQLSERDARLATEIVYGTLRTLPELDAVLDKYLTRGRPDPFTHTALRAATYQALFLGRVPPFAIVQETVNLVKAKRGDRLGKLVNAVLRRVVSERPDDPKPPTTLRVAPWIERALVTGLGPERAHRTLALDERPPPLGLRVPKGIDLESVRAAIEAEVPRAQVLVSDVVPNALCAWGIGDPRKLASYSSGQFASQDEGAQLVGRLADAQPGERVLDACAGRGGKTAQLIEAVGPKGHVTAVDIHEAKLEQIAQELTRLKLPGANLTCESIDFSVGEGGLERGFDRILVDAPCTGLGTLRRRPEIALRLTDVDPARMAALQLAVLRNALLLLRRGGILVFAVCSGTREEGLEVAEKLEAREPGIRRLRKPVSGVNVTPDDDGVFRLGPWLSKQSGAPDVYQVVRWEMLDSHSGPV